MKNALSFLMFLLVLIPSIEAQFSLHGEFRPRIEYRHGFGQPLSTESDAGFGTATRLRLNAFHELDNYSFFVSLQDILVWGENRQLLPNDTNNSFAVFQAWAALGLGNGLSIKLGRQTVDYDDQRIMGSVDWAQQARNHDMALFKYQKQDLQLDLGLAFNQDHDDLSGYQSDGTTYLTTGNFSYKTMFYLYTKHQWTHFSSSLLLMNNSFQNFREDGTSPNGSSDLQTLGTHLAFKKGLWSITANAFLQTGQRQGELDVKGAFLLAMDTSYKVTEKMDLGAGAEVVSGNDPTHVSETAAFFPLYGTNHKFNGYMDYFYVGNHANSVGLVDMHLSTTLKFGEKSSLMAKVLDFRAQRKLPSGTKYLGTELDLVFSQGLKGYSIQLGYSHLFPSEGMHQLKGTIPEGTVDQQYWAWAMLILKPKFIN